MLNLRTACGAAILMTAACSHAQKPIGTVSTADASVGGVLETSGGTATIVNNGTVTAHEHTATVTLARGGTVQVCATSVVHLSQSATASGGPLLVALDHGALEATLLAGSGDAILTPDMRMQPAAPGQLDLRIRVVSNGDTCVENRGSDAPALMISDTFGESSYIVHPQQHVLFEHGSLRQVVDSESSPCGCPPPVVSIADSGVSGTTIAKSGSEVATSAEAHPFPAAVSQGLAPSPMPPAQAPGQTHAQLNLTLAYNGSAPAISSADATTGTGTAGGALATANNSVTEMTTPQPAAASAVNPATPAASPAVAQAPPPPPPPTGDLAHMVVRFYRWVFHRKS